MFPLGLQFMIHGVILSICHEHLFLCIYASCLSVFVKPRYTEIQSFRRDRVNIHTECSYTPFFCWLLFWQQKETSSTRKKHLASTAFTLSCNVLALKMQNSHENRKNNPCACTPTKTYIQPVSIKVLFPQNQCKSLFRKFTTKSMKIYTSQYNKNMIHNVSNHTLTEDELSVLPKGLFFVLTPTKTFKQETNKSWNKFKTRMLTQYFFFATKLIINHPLLKGNPAGHLLPWTT